MDPAEVDSCDDIFSYFYRDRNGHANPARRRVRAGGVRKMDCFLLFAYVLAFLWDRHGTTSLDLEFRNLPTAHQRTRDLFRFFHELDFEFLGFVRLPASSELGIWTHNRV